MEALPKTFVWQLLDGKHDSSILSETVSIVWCMDSIF